MSPVMYTKALGKSLGKVAGEAGRINFVACGVTATTKMRGCYMLVRGIMRLRREDGCSKTRNIGRDIFTDIFTVTMIPSHILKGERQKSESATIVVKLKNKTLTTTPAFAYAYLQCRPATKRPSAKFSTPSPTLTNGNVVNLFQAVV